ncbi:MAG: hypothetical protein HA495_02200 [Thaumarchaeota archaeon]|nr:hypothetical protein [Nitrososphaerota archaeon]
MKVLYKKSAEVIPFAPYDNLIPRGTFERKLRNRGMGLCHRHPLYWTETPDVRTEHWIQNGIEYTIYKTPVGNVSTSRKIYVGRIADGGAIYVERMIKDKKDYEPVIYMLDNTVFHDNYEDFLNAVRDYGNDGIVRGEGIGPPYDLLSETSFDYFGQIKWALEQRVNFNDFRKLLDALERYNERAWPIVVNSPADFVSLGELSGLYGPNEFRTYCLPFYKRYVPQLKNKGKICSIHAHALNLKAFKEVIAETEVDVVEAFTPLPVGNLSITEARAAWGSNVVIWLNFPETVFYQGPEKTKQYTISLLKSDVGNPLVIGFTEMGLYGIKDKTTELFFKRGFEAIMSAIEDFSEKEL